MPQLAPRTSSLPHIATHPALSHVPPFRAPPQPSHPAPSLPHPLSLPRPVHPGRVAGRASWLATAWSSTGRRGTASLTPTSCTSRWQPSCCTTTRRRWWNTTNTWTSPSTSPSTRSTPDTPDSTQHGWLDTALLDLSSRSWRVNVVIAMWVLCHKRLQCVGYQAGFVLRHRSRGKVSLGQAYLLLGRCVTKGVRCHIYWMM